MHAVRGITGKGPLGRLGSNEFVHSFYEIFLTDGWGNIMIMVRGCGFAAAASCYEEPYAGWDMGKTAWSALCEGISPAGQSCGKWPRQGSPVGKSPYGGENESGGGDLSDGYRRKSS